MYHEKFVAVSASAIHHFVKRVKFGFQRPLTHSRSSHDEFRTESTGLSSKHQQWRHKVVQQPQPLQTAGIRRVLSGMPTDNLPTSASEGSWNRCACRWKTWPLANRTSLIPGLISGNGTTCPGLCLDWRQSRPQLGPAPPVFGVESDSGWWEGQQQRARLSLSLTPALWAVRVTCPAGEMRFEAAEKPAPTSV